MTAWNAKLTCYNMVYDYNESVIRIIVIINEYMLSVACCYFADHRVEALIVAHVPANFD